MPIESQPAQGLKKTQHGVNYQIALIVLATVRAYQRQKKTSFTIYSESPEHGKFDDLVIELNDSVICMQIKHSSTDNPYTDKDFKDKNKDFSLSKYFSSWLKIREKHKGKNCQFVMFTNRDILEQDKFLETNEKVTCGGLFEFENNTNSKTLKFKKAKPKVQQ